MHDGNDAAENTGVMVRKRRKGIYILPNLFTLAALFGGFYSIVMAMNGRFDQAAVGVFCAMVLDSLDGRVARMTHTQSAFGEQIGLGRPVHGFLVGRRENVDRSPLLDLCEKRARGGEAESDFRARAGLLERLAHGLKGVRQARGGGDHDLLGVQGRRAE